MTNNTHLKRGEHGTACNAKSISHPTVTADVREVTCKSCQRTLLYAKEYGRQGVK